MRKSSRDFAAPASLASKLSSITSARHRPPGIAMPPRNASQVRSSTRG